jgi:hypothetical protein
MSMTVMDSYIGWWGRRTGSWHLVQSEITDRLVMKCGRQMKLVTPEGRLEFLLEPSIGKCQQCVGRSEAAE